MSDIGSEEAKEKENSWVKNKRTNVRTVKWNRNKQTNKENEKYKIKQYDNIWVSKELHPPRNKQNGSEKWKEKSSILNS